MPITELRSENCFFLPALQALSNSSVGPRVFIIPDTLADKRVRDHPLVVGAPHICFYAGVPIFSKSRQLLGVLSVFDTASRELTVLDREALSNLRGCSVPDWRLAPRRAANAAPHRNPSLMWPRQIRPAKAVKLTSASSI